MGRRSKYHRGNGGRGERHVGNREPLASSHISRINFVLSAIVAILPLVLVFPLYYYGVYMRVGFPLLPVMLLLWVIMMYSAMLFFLGAIFVLHSFKLLRFNKRWALW